MATPHILSAVTGDGGSADVVPVTRALISVSDKTDIVEFAWFLASKGVELLSTGGTAKKLRDAALTVTDVSEYTGHPECLDGRVKTLHPKVHGGLLGVRGNVAHEADMESLGIGKIDMTVVNLYPFEATVRSGADFDTCVENIDIGGPSMLRSTAKNHAFTTVVTSPDQYEEVRAVMAANNGGTTLALRRKFAARAFALSAAYDSAIATWFSQQMAKEEAEKAAAAAAASTPGILPSQTSKATSMAVVARAYQPQFTLKYGCNPHQKPASLGSIVGVAPKLPFTVLNGTPGYINLLDAANAWQLVRELKEATGLAAAASFKHVSPAGAAVAVPLSDLEKEAYEISEDLTPSSLAYVRARNADPLCSFGDFAALSDVVDAATAAFLKKEVSDGIVAPGYEPEALEILKAKKSGKFILLEADANYQPPEQEYREVYGMAFAQLRNNVVMTQDHMTKEIKTSKSDLTQDAIRDLIVASIGVKYTQSNSVGFAKSGMMVGVGAGQQSRVDCVKLASRKVQTWFLRQHPKVLGLPFKSTTKRQQRVNARVRYIEGGNFTPEEMAQWLGLFETTPQPLTEAEKASFLQEELSGVALSSDAFFPFRDSIDVASKVGVSFVAQPGGSVQDDSIIAACDEYDMVMSFTGVRLFHH